MDTIENQACDIVYFDGVCNLCNRIVIFIIKNDTKQVFKFSPLQLADIDILPLSKSEFESLIIKTCQGNYLEKGEAAIYILRRLRFPYWALGLASFLPSKLVDSIYDWIAKNRYRWFGISEKCMVPNENLKQRFILL